MALNLVTWKALSSKLKSVTIKLDLGGFVSIDQSGTRQMEKAAICLPLYSRLHSPLCLAL